MTDRLIARIASFALSAVVTVVMLASVNLLATPEPVAASLLATAGVLLA